MDKLLPCPFCGNDGLGPIEEALHIAFTEHDWRGPFWTVQCDKCTATMGYSDSEDEAIEAWNTRALDADALIEAAWMRGAAWMRERVIAAMPDNQVGRLIVRSIRALPLTEETPDAE